MFNSETPAADILKFRLEKGEISRGDFKKYMETLNKLGEVKGELEKASKGEGSLGGKVIGHTKTGKPIYENKLAHHRHYENFSSKDHNDASSIHQKLGDKFDDKYTKSQDEQEAKEHKENSKHHYNVSDSHAEMAKKKEDGEKPDKLQKAVTEDTLEKALSDDLRYGSDIKFKKTGKEVVTALDKAYKICELNKTEAAATLAALGANLPNDPFVPCNSYRYNGFQKEIGEQFCFPWDMCYVKDSSRNGTYMTEYSDSNTTTKKVDYTAMMPYTQTEADQYRQYNVAVENFISVCAECLMIGVYKRNIDQSKTYEISPSVAAGLGF